MIEMHSIPVQDLVLFGNFFASSAYYKYFNISFKLTCFPIKKL